MNTEKSNTSNSLKSWLPRGFALLGACGVALGAFGAHALKEIRSAQQLETWKTATMYLLVHAVFGLLLSLQASDANEEISGGAKAKIPVSALYLLLAGCIIFSGALYALVLLQISPLGAVAPLGGLMMILGWLTLVARLRI
jgi:uncharacterized membrane protein YgdD (TMEM256/DUF423 family)